MGDIRPLSCINGLSDVTIPSCAEGIRGIKPPACLQSIQRPACLDDFQGPSCYLEEYSCVVEIPEPPSCVVSRVENDDDDARYRYKTHGSDQKVTSVGMTSNTNDKSVGMTSNTNASVKSVGQSSATSRRNSETRDETVNAYTSTIDAAGSDTNIFKDISAELHTDMDNCTSVVASAAVDLGVADNDDEMSLTTATHVRASWYEQQSVSTMRYFQHGAPGSNRMNRASRAKELTIEKPRTIEANNGGSDEWDDLYPCPSITI